MGLLMCTRDLTGWPDKGPNAPVAARNPVEEPTPAGAPPPSATSKSSSSRTPPRKRARVAYGLEMDEPYEGGNNGTYQGKRYFPCDESHGRFVHREEIVENKHAQHVPGRRINKAKRRIRALYSAPMTNPAFEALKQAAVLPANKARSSTKFGPVTSPVSEVSDINLPDGADAISMMRKMLQEKFGADVDGDKEISLMLQKMSQAIGQNNGRLMNLKIVNPADMTDGGDSSEDGDEELERFRPSEGDDQLGALVSPTPGISISSPGSGQNWDYTMDPIGPSFSDTRPSPPLKTSRIPRSHSFTTGIEYLGAHGREEAKDPMFEMGKIFTGDIDLNKNPMSNMGLIDFQENMATRARKRSRVLSQTMSRLPSMADLMQGVKAHTRSSSASRRSSLINLRRHSLQPHHTHKKHFSVPSVKLVGVHQVEQKFPSDEEEFDEPEPTKEEAQRQKEHQEKMKNHTTKIDELDTKIREKNTEMQQLRNRSIALLTKQDDEDGDEEDNPNLETNYYRIEVQLARLAEEKRALMDQHDEAMTQLQQQMLENVFDPVPVMPEVENVEEIEEPPISSDEDDGPSGLRDHVVKDLGIDLIRDLNIGVDELLDIAKAKYKV